MPNMKREATILAGEVEVDIDAPRAKRHKPGQPSNSAASPANEDHSTTSAVHNGVGDAAREVLAVKEDSETVRERGLKLWQAIKDATNKECVEFQTLSSSGFAL
jgi:chromatin structure-remodeling complex subunit RSC4